MYSVRENYLAFLNHETTDWVPSFAVDQYILGSQLEYWENGPLAGGRDGFGCNWIPTSSAAGQPALDPELVPLDDVCDWEDKVRFPDLDAIDWKAFAEQQLAGKDRNERVFEYHTWNSVFLRLTHLLSFEDALCAFYEEPEATYALCMAIADYKVRLLERVAEYLKPDAYVHYDDVATSRSLFMSPEIYRQFIKPAHTRMNEAAQQLGIIPEIHICGHCEDILPDVIEEGSVAWQAAQPINDICNIIETLGDKLSVMGGYDTQGAPGQDDVTDELTCSEVRRCLDEYGKYGHSYGFQGFKLSNMRDPVMAGEVVRYRQLLPTYGAASAGKA